MRDEADEQLSRAMLSEDDPAVLAEFALLEAACAAELAASSAHPALGMQLSAASVRDSSVLVSELPAAPSHPVNIATDLAVNIAAPGPVIRKPDAPVVLLS